MTDVVGRGTIELVGDSRKLSASIAEAKRSLIGLGIASKDATKGQSASIDRYVKSLGVAAVTAGKTGRELELLKLGLRGASVAQLAAADAALRLSEKHEQTVKSVAALRSGFVLLGTVAVAGSIAAAAAFDQLVKKAGDFQDMAEKIGDTASSIASLSVAAAVGNLSMESLVSVANKLSKNLTGIDDESSAAGQAIATLGINLEELKAQSPTERLVTIANAFDKFGEKGDRAAVAIALFGKAGAEALPFLKELSSGVGLQSILTDEQIKLADEYSDRQKKLSAQISLHAQAIAIELLPALTDFKQAIADIAKDQEHAATASDFLKSAIGGLINVFQVVTVLGSDLGFIILSIGREIGALAAQFQALQRLDIKNFNKISDAVKEDAELARKELDKFQARILAIGTESGKAIVAGAKESTAPEKPKLEFLGAEAAAAQIKLIDEVSKFAQNAIEKGIAADIAATQARLASTSNLLSTQRELERAELDSIGRRAAAAIAAFEKDKALTTARGDAGSKANQELLASGTKLYDSLIAQNTAYLNVYKANQAQILAIDKQVANARRSTAELIRQVDEAGLSDDQKAGALRTRLLERESEIKRALLKEDTEEQQRLFELQQREAKEFADMGFRHGRTFLEDNQKLFEQGAQARKNSASSIAEAAKTGLQVVAEQINDLRGQMKDISENALSGIKIRFDQTSLSSFVSAIRSAIESEEFKVNLKPLLSGVSFGSFGGGDARERLSQFNGDVTEVLAGT